jgi:hypothetical protein
MALSTVIHQVFNVAVHVAALAMLVSAVLFIFLHVDASIQTNPEKLKQRMSQSCYYQDMLVTSFYIVAIATAGPILEATLHTCATAIVPWCSSLPLVFDTPTKTALAITSLFVLLQISLVILTLVKAASRVGHQYLQLARSTPTWVEQVGPASPLLRLPGELRNQIYRLAIVQNDRVSVMTTGITEPGLLVNHQLREEAAPTFYSEKNSASLHRTITHQR